MAVHNGYLLIADISGYTAFLTSSEQDHANPILKSLLTSLVEQVGDPLHFWRMDGDAVLAYSSSQEFPSGEVFLSICENFYNAFATLSKGHHRQHYLPCRACANVTNLDLKIMAHYGSFEEMKFGPVTDISGSDVILVHRMAKTDVKEATGIRSYALFSDAAVKAMDIDAALTPFSQTYRTFRRSLDEGLRPGRCLGEVPQRGRASLPGGSRTVSGRTAAILTFPSLSSGRR